MQSRVIFDKDLAFYAKIMWHEPNFGKFLHTLICNSNQRKKKTTHKFKAYTLRTFERSRVKMK